MRPTRISQPLVLPVSNSPTHLATRPTPKLCNPAHDSLPVADGCFP